MLHRADDEQGRAFVTFAIDERRGRWRRKWRKNRIVGCVYVKKGRIFVKRGKRYYRRTILFGKRTRALPPSTCKSATAGTIARR